MMGNSWRWILWGEFPHYEIEIFVFLQMGSFGSYEMICALFSTT